MKELKPETLSGQEALFNEGVYFSDPKLYSIAQRAHRESQEKFCNLFHQVTEKRVIKALSRINIKSGKGPDGIRQSLAVRHSDWLLPSHLDAIHKCKYQAPASRRVYIPKANGGKRPLGVGNIIDRGIQGALREVLDHIYEQDFLSCSFGFRPKRGAHNALATLNHGIRDEGLRYFLEVDLENFFGTINHKWMMEFLEHRIADKRVLTVIRSWLKAGVIKEGKTLKNESGVAQGGAISPLLANIYLHYVLDLWFEKKIKPRLKGRSRLIRYADDFVVGFTSEAECRDFKVLLEARLLQFGLRINQSKTHITGLRAGKSSKPGLIRRHIKLLGFKIFLSQRLKGSRPKIVYKTDSQRLTASLRSIKEHLWHMMHWSPAEQSRYLNQVLRGLFNYYGLAGNGKGLGLFRHKVIHIWRRTLSRRSQVSNVSWAAMEILLKKHKLTQPRLKIPYSRLDAYVIV